MTEEKKYLKELGELLRRANELVSALEAEELPPELLTESSREQGKKEEAEPKKESEVSKLLRDLGIPANIRGYHYIRTGIMLALKDPEILHFITKDLYPAIAKEYETTATKVERAIRHAVEKSMVQGDSKLLEEIFSYSYSSKKGKPTNAEYIATLVDYLNIKN